MTIGKDRDSFEEALKKRFDELVEAMNKPGAREGYERFFDLTEEELARTYHPGSTELDTNAK